MNKVLTQFQSIRRHSGASAYLVEPVEGMTNAFAGRSSANRAVFILADTIEPNRPIQTGALTIDIGVAFEAQLSGGRRKLDRALVIELLQSSSELELYFSEICSALQFQIVQMQSESDILSHLRTLAELFGFKQVSREMVKGIWGELKFASFFPDLQDSIGNWHNGSLGRVDFDSTASGWEVKTSEGSERKHRLKLSQLSRDSDLLVSLCVEESPAGQSLAELIDAIIPKLPNDLQFKVRVRVLSYSSSKAFFALKLKLQNNDLGPRLYKVADLFRPVVPDTAVDYISGVSFSLLIGRDVPGIPLLDQESRSLSFESLKLLASA